MRILIALTYYRPHYSGLTIYAERAARALAQRGHQVTVLTSRYDPNLPGREVKDGVEIIRPKVWLRVSKGVIMPTMLLWAWKLARQADVVQLHVPQLDAAPIALIARLLGKPVVLTYHCDLILPKGPVHWVANRVSNLANFISASAAQVIVQNTEDYSHHSPFLRRFLKKIHAVFCPVELSPATPEDEQAFIEKAKLKPGQRLIGMVARLATEKGVEYLAQALPLVLEKHPTARVLFVGPYQNVVGEEAYAHRLAPLLDALDDHWTFLGVLPNGEFTSFLQACEVTVLPSINSTESYGIVQVESMMCATPVVASNMPGMRVPLQMTEMGRLFPPGDPQALAQALIAILDQPENYRGHPQELLAASTPQAVAAAYEAIYAQLQAR